MKKTIRVVILLAIFGLSMTAMPSCDKQENQSIEQSVKKSGETITWDEFVESLDLTDTIDSPYSCIEGPTRSGSYVAFVLDDDGHYLESFPEFFGGDPEGLVLCCRTSGEHGSSYYCWAVNCEDCNCDQHGEVVEPIICD